MTKDIVILTKSTKRGGYCVAGIDIDSGEWVRLTSSDEWSHGALTNAHMTYADGTACKVLDCVRVEVVREVPIAHQPENVLIDEKRKFQKLGEWTLQDVLRVHPPEQLDTVYVNTDPFLDEDGMERVDRSLVLIRVPWLRLFQRAINPEKTRVKVNFLYNDEFYNNISMTDPEYYGVEDQTNLKNAYIVVSLPDVPYDDGQYYKFIAKIFE